MRNLRVSQTLKSSLVALATIGSTLIATPAEAAGAAAAAGGASVTSDSTAPTSAAPANSNGNDSGFLMAGKVGGIASFNGLSPFLHGGLELGWAFAGRRMAALLQVEYSAPPAKGSVTEQDFDPDRVPDSSYNWKLVQKELVFQPTFMYRLTDLSDSFTPYTGIGPRIYLLQSVVSGSASGQSIGKSYERSTGWGVGVPLGAELKLGPGGLFAEMLFQWGPLKHQTTGDTNLGGGSLFLGYRAIL